MKKEPLKVMPVGECLNAVQNIIESVEYDAKKEKHPGKRRSKEQSLRLFTSLHIHLQKVAEQ